MRLSARDCRFGVRVAPEANRPVRLGIGGLTFCLESAEAVDLATQLADAVADLKRPKALEFFNTGKDES